MHHYELGEGSDPDLLERNAHNVRISKVCTNAMYLRGERKKNLVYLESKRDASLYSKGDLSACATPRTCAPPRCVE
jgi:hypothetical protein